MPERSVFLVYCEVSGSSPALQNEGFAGAFVTVFVATEDIEEAVEQAKSALDEDGYELAGIDKTMRFDPKEWTHDNAIMQIAREVQQDGEIGYSQFKAWGH